MRIPKNISLEKYIKDLIEADELWRFYKTNDWLELKRRILEDNNFECRTCKLLGKYTRAQCVHHVNHVKKNPSLALSRYYLSDGKKKENLIPLCNACHNKEHPEKQGSFKNKPRFTNIERW